MQDIYFPYFFKTYIPNLIIQFVFKKADKNCQYLELSPVKTYCKLY